MKYNKSGTTVFLLQVLRWHACLQVAANQSGSLVYKIDPLAPAHEVLKENDVVMEIDKVPIADDGTVEFRNEERVEFSHIVRAKHIGTFSFLQHMLQMPPHRMRKGAPVSGLVVLHNSGCNSALLQLQ